MCQCENTTSQPTHRPSILCLPPAVRHSIYCYAGLITGWRIGLNSRPLPLDGPFARLTTWLTDEAAHFSLTRNLLRTCRTIYAEVIPVIYGTNKFFIRYENVGSLLVLRNIAANSISYLTHLTVHLNVASCGRGNSCPDALFSDLWRSCSKREYDDPLRNSSPRHQAILSEWQRTANHIITHLSPSRLHLDFVCDVEHLAAAERAVRPLLLSDTSTLPLLAACKIRLGRWPNAALQLLARKTAIQATMGRCASNQQTDGLPFRFIDLPRELRLHILGYTDLVTPLSEVEWSTDNGFRVHYCTFGCGGKYQCCMKTGLADELPRDELHYACRFRNCWEGTDSGCFCSLHHAAFSFRCQCWKPPAYLFLVCRALREDAQEVFFKRNRFVIVPSGGCHLPAGETPERLDVSIFLTQIVPSNALGFLRFLEIVFPPFKGDYLRSDEPAYYDWLSTLDKVKGELNLPMLTLRVYMESGLPVVGGGQVPGPSRANMAKEQALVILKMYERTLNPLCKMKGLGRFFVHLAWPQRWTSEWRCMLKREGMEYEEQKVDSLERKIERHVMGDEYDSSLEGKGELRNSQWLEEYYEAAHYAQYT